MFEKGLFGFWFCLLAVFFQVRPGLAQDLDPAQCLISRTYNLIRLSASLDLFGKSCWQDCKAEPGCHMAVVSTPLRGSAECLLVNCLNQGRLSHPRDPTASIDVYPKRTMDEEQRKKLMEGSFGPFNEKFRRCLHSEDRTSFSNCQTGIPRFFYNRTSYRCERYFDGCGSNKNSFYSQEGCEALCNDKYLCYRPMEHGARPPFRVSYDPPAPGEILPHNFIFYNISSYSCEGFYFKGSASNGNIFHTVKECESLCGDVKATTTSQPAEDPDAPAPVTSTPPAVLIFGIPVIIIVIIIVLIIIIVIVANSSGKIVTNLSDKEQ